jgi:hypothetical protein
MVGAITKELIPLGVQLPQMEREVVGGYFIWLTLPHPLKGSIVTQRAEKEENLIIAPGKSKTTPYLLFSVCSRFADMSLSLRGENRVTMTDLPRY